MKILFEMPELLTLNGEPFNGVLEFNSSGQNCTSGCDAGCCAGCESGVLGNGGKIEEGT